MVEGRRAVSDRSARRACASGRSFSAHFLGRPELALNEVLFDLHPPVDCVIVLYE